MLVEGDVRNVAFPIHFANRLHETERAVFNWFRLSLFPKDPFFQIIYMYLLTHFKNRNYG